MQFSGVFACSIVGDCWQLLAIVGKYGYNMYMPKSAKHLQKYKFTSETSREQLRRRQEITRGAAITGMIRAIQAAGYPVTSAGAAFGVLVQRQVELMVKGDRLDINWIEKFRRIITGADIIEDTPTRERGAGVPAGMVAASPDVLLELIRIIERERDKRGAIDTESSG